MKFRKNYLLFYFALLGIIISYGCNKKESPNFHVGEWTLTETNEQFFNDDLQDSFTTNSTLELIDNDSGILSRGVFIQNVYWCLHEEGTIVSIVLSSDDSQNNTTIVFDVISQENNEQLWERTVIFQDFDGNETKYLLTWELTRN